MMVEAMLVRRRHQSQECGIPPSWLFFPKLVDVSTLIACHPSFSSADVTRK
jgi:hypothetical protein